jgi:hypothetical protein
MPPFDPTEFMVRLRSGATPREITSGILPGAARIDGVGSYKAFDAYCAANPEWGREAAILVERNTAAAQKRKGGGRGSLTHCKNGHPFSGDNLIWKPRSDGGRGLWRCCKACKKETTKRGALMKPSELIRVTEAVKAGFKIVDITRNTFGRKAIVTNSKLRRHRLEHPEFDRFLVEHSRNPCSRAQLMRFQIVPENAAFFSLTEARPEVPPFEMRPGDYDWILSLISHGLPYDMRMDIAQDVVEALLRRAIGREHVPRRIVDFLSRHKKAVGDPYYDDSLDAPLTAEGKMTRIDVVSYDRWKADSND